MFAMEKGTKLKTLPTGKSPPGTSLKIRMQRRAQNLQGRNVEGMGLCPDKVQLYLEKKILM